MAPKTKMTAEQVLAEKEARDKDKPVAENTTVSQSVVKAWYAHNTLMFKRGRV